MTELQSMAFLLELTHAGEQFTLDVIFSNQDYEIKSTYMEGEKKLTESLSAHQSGALKWYRRFSPVGANPT